MHSNTSGTQRLASTSSSDSRIESIYDECIGIKDQQNASNSNIILFDDNAVIVVSKHNQKHNICKIQ